METLSDGLVRQIWILQGLTCRHVTLAACCAARKQNGERSSLTTGFPVC